MQVGFICKRKEEGKKWMEIMSIKRRGGQRLKENSIFNFYFLFWKTSLFASIQTMLGLCIAIQTNDIEGGVVQFFQLGSNQ